MRDRKIRTGAFCLGGIIVIVFTLMWLQYVYRAGFFREDLYTTADALVNTMKPYAYGLGVLPVLVFLTVYSAGQDFHTAKILLRGDKKTVWRYQQKKLLILSVYLAVIFLAVIFLYGQYRHQPLFNWNSTSSYYFLVNHDVFQGNAAQVVFTVGLLCIWRNYIFGNIILLSKWRTRMFLPGVIVSVGITVIEIALPRVRILISELQPGYSMFMNQLERIHIVLGGAVWLWMIYMVTERAVRKREFFHERNC